MLVTIRHLLSLVRFSHTVFALPFALLAAMMAWRLQFLNGWAAREIAAGRSEPELILEVSLRVLADRLGGDVESFPRGFSIRWQELLGILLCMVTARSAAMAFNRLADRKHDAENPRTVSRHLPAGVLSITQVIAFTTACGLSFLASTLLFLPNRLPLYLSVPVLLFLFGYSYAKRFTSLAHFWLGAALASSPVAAWIAIRGERVLASPSDLTPALLLGGAVFAWVAGFDILYACQDVDFDRSVNLHSVPARLGVAGALRLAAGCHFATIVCLSLLPLAYPPFGSIFGAGVAAVALLLAYEHALVRPNDLDRVNTAFFNVNGVISLGLLAVGVADLLFG